MAGMSTEYRVRLRHVCGDLGPYSVRGGTEMKDLAEKAFADWPSEGPMSVDPPLEATEVRFISSGRILKDCERVQDLVVGAYAGAQDDDEDFILTVHAVVRPPKPPKKSSKKGKSGQGGRNASSARSGAVESSGGSSGQCCTIS